MNREHLSAPDSLANLFCYQVTFSLSNPPTMVTDLVTVGSASFGGSVAEPVLFLVGSGLPSGSWLKIFLSLDSKALLRALKNQN